jgi:hypothetical protein
MNKIFKYSMITSVLLLLMFIPEKFIFQSQISMCILKNLTGAECPFCGMTRASFEMLHLNILSAIRYNPACLFLPVILVSEIASDIFPSLIMKKSRQIALILFIAGLAGLFVFRIFQFYR